MRKRMERTILIISSVVLTAMMVFSGGIFIIPPESSTSSHVIMPAALAAPAYSDWHEGVNQTTSLVNVTYSENYSTVSQPINNTLTQMSLLQRFMWLQYNDNTSARVGFELHCVFYPGGINLTEQKVVNWSKLYNVELILHSETWEDNRTVGTMYSFQGFDIVRGNASNVSLVKMSEGNGSYFYVVNNTIGSISFWTNFAKIGNVSLSTDPDNESIAKFNVSLNANIGNGSSEGYLPGTTANLIPAVLSFTVTHNLSSTEYKYGANVDWSSVKSFPTSVPMKSGDNYNLVAKDLLMFYVGGTNGEFKQFTTDAANDTAVYSLGNQTLCREFFTRNYTIDNTSTLHNTVRIYVGDATHDQFSNVSTVFVVFGGFTYGKSSSLYFDPAVVTPNSVKSASIPPTTPSWLPYPIVIVVIAAGVLLFMRYRKK